MVYNDYTGKQFGRWTLLKELGGNKVLCRCTCGTEKTLQKNSILSGGSCSCGCGSIHALKDLTGKVFCNLTVIKFDKIEIRGSNKRTYWVCQCKCGNIRSFRADLLVSGRRKSCGCYLKDKGSVGLTCLFGDYKYRSKKRGIYFDLTLDQFKDLTSKNCFYCGVEPSQVSAGSSNVEHTTYKYNGLDQVVPKNGYSVDSVVPCCAKCNTAKLQLSQEDFKNHINKIYDFWASKENICEPIYDFIEEIKEKGKSVLCSYRHTAKRKNLSFNLTPDQFYYLTKQNCFYCGSVSSREKYSYVYNGLDRIDSKKGYEIGNVRSCCFTCNSAKSTMTQEEFKSHIKRIHDHWAGK
jgi:5-methylcytosine-specific restriction endonuclease McrA